MRETNQVLDNRQTHNRNGERNTEQVHGKYRKTETHRKKE